MSQTKSNSNLVAIITMCFIFAMISFVTNMAAPFGTIWKNQYEWAGMTGNLMNFLAYLFMGIPAGNMLTKVGYHSRCPCSRFHWHLHPVPQQLRVPPRLSHLCLSARRICLRLLCMYAQHCCKPHAEHARRWWQQG